MGRNRRLGGQAFGAIAEQAAILASIPVLTGLGQGVARTVRLVKEWRALYPKWRPAYEALDVGPEARLDEIRLAWKRASAKWHPDRWTRATEAERAAAESRIREINQAWDLIRDHWHVNPYRREVWPIQRMLRELLMVVRRNLGTTGANGVRLIGSGIQPPLVFSE